MSWKITHCENALVLTCLTRQGLFNKSRLLLVIKKTWFTSVEKMQVGYRVFSLWLQNHLNSIIYT